MDISLRRDFYKRRRCRMLVLLVLGYAVVFEWLVYLVHPLWNWPRLPVHNEISVRLLLVADPQLLGRSNTAVGPLGYIERWDSDRFIRKTHELAHYYFKPDVTIFLGDLFDEGEIASNKDFWSYMQRFLRIFSAVRFRQAVIIPGDNDIGGELTAPQEREIRRFNSYFRNDSVTSYGGVDFIKVNYLTKSYAYRSYLTRLGRNLRVVLSHMALSSTYGPYGKEVMKDLDPDLMFAGHRHVSEHVAARRQDGSVESLRLRFTDDRVAVRLNLSRQLVHEIEVPTCSYRMGTHTIGFGAAIIDPDRTLTYGVLWSPDRLLHLECHLVVLSVSGLVLLLWAGVLHRAAACLGIRTCSAGV
ncbi:unnamed protein product [Ixodes hexagonus]